MHPAWAHVQPRTDPVLENARVAVHDDPACAWTEPELAKLHRALLVAPDLATLEALLRGDPVPLNRLDRDGLRRVGRYNRA